MLREQQQFDHLPSEFHWGEWDNYPPWPNK